MKLQGTRWFYTESPENIDSLDVLAEHLHSLLASGTYVNDDGNPDGPILIEAKELAERIDGMKIEIYAKEHPPPHFHVVTANNRASFTLDKCELLDGALPSKQRRKIEYWFFTMNAKSVLIEIWNRTRPEGCVVGQYVGQGN